MLLKATAFIPTTTLPIPAELLEFEEPESLQLSSGRLTNREEMPKPAGPELAPVATEFPVMLPLILNHCLNQNRHQLRAGA